ncbi:uncharacterized protein [Palaemon carinicauda]|uniref:uncharacterized protein n=1 Tax=Palaemon carinicauda TaxID=392227 RepID=UPI0035B63658
MFTRLAILLIGMVTAAQARPRLLESFGVVASGGVDLLGTVSEAGHGVSDAFSDTFGTIRTFGDEFRGLVHGAWNAGKQTARRFTSAVQDTARGVARGISDTAGAVNTYFADNVRAGGRLASGAVGAGFGVARGAVGATGNLLHDVRGTVKGGFDDTADAVDDFAGDVIDSHVNLISSATGVAENVAMRGIENFAHVLAPSKF